MYVFAACFCCPQMTKQYIISGLSDKIVFLKAPFVSSASRLHHG